MEQKSINLLDLVPGTHVQLADGSAAEVVENPGDGTWIFCRYLSNPNPTMLDEADHPVFAADVIAILPQAGTA